MLHNTLIARSNWRRYWKRWQ